MWGILSLACLLAVPAQNAERIFYTNQKSQRVPITIEPARRGDIREMMLFVSDDKGTSYRQESVIGPDKDGFVYHAPRDGEYWLRVAVVNNQLKQEPKNPAEGKPDQIWLIDTLKPVVKLGTPQRQGDEVVVSWEIEEEHPDPGTLKLEYQVQNGPDTSWVPVPLNSARSGQARFRPGTPAGLSLRMSFTDLARNTAQTMVELPGTVAQAGFSGTAPAGNSGAVAPPVAPTPNQTPLGPPPPSNQPEIRTQPPPLSDPLSFGPRPPGPPSDLRPPPYAVASEPNNRVVVPSDNPARVPGPAAFVATSRKPLPAVQYVNNPQLTLEYELAKVGPSGIGTVELWWTPDDGKTWDCALNPDLKDEEVKNNHYHRMVKLEEGDRIYGFALVVRSRAGLGKPPPRSGDVPELRVELDTTPPVVDLCQPRPDSLRHDALLLSWYAKDKNLAANPITWEWSEQADGPWQTIAAAIANTEQYSWQPPAGVVQAYLRLRVRDLAGNEEVRVTREPQLVDLTEPEGRLVKVSVTPRR